MVPPSGLADTVTPPMVLPSGDLTVPLKSASAKAGTETRIAATAERVATIKPRRIGFSMILVGIARRAGFDRRRCVGRRGNGFDIGDDGVDLRRLEVIFEARHARRAVADDLAHDVGLAAERIHRQHRRILRAHQLWLGVTDAARLVEQPHAERRLIAAAARRLRCRGKRPKHKRQRYRPRAAAHAACLPAIFYSCGKPTRRPRYGASGEPSMRAVLTIQAR